MILGRMKGQYDLSKLLKFVEIRLSSPLKAKHIIIAIFSSNSLQSKNKCSIYNSEAKILDTLLIYDNEQAKHNIFTPLRQYRLVDDVFDESLALFTRFTQLLCKMSNVKMRKCNKP